MNIVQKKIILSEKLSKELVKIYTELEKGYNIIADELNFSCHGCPDNCCDSYFLHHTYTEWAYLWQGLQVLEDNRRAEIICRAKEYSKRSQARPAKQPRSPIPCPLLDKDGLCSLYQHRMLVCRMHGVPAEMTRPDGQSLHFPGCFRCQEIVANKYPQGKNIPTMDRTGLFQKMVVVESELLGEKRHLLPRVRMTIADMIIKGPPMISVEP